MDIASQSPSGASILRRAQDGGLRVVYRPDLCEQLQAGAGFDHRNNTIFFGDVFDDPLIMAITLCHEARHSIQHSGGVAVGSGYAPASMLKMALACEADTRAHQIQVGMELAFLKDGQGQELYPEALNELFVTLKEIPGIDDLFDRAIADPSMLSDGRLMRECFEGFYTSAFLRQAYEQVVLGNISWFPKAFESAAHYTREMTSETLVERLTDPDRPYLKSLPPDLLDRPFFAAVAPETKETMRRLKLQRGEILGRPENGPGWRFDHVYKIHQPDTFTPPAAVLDGFKAGNALPPPSPGGAGPAA